MKKYFKRAKKKTDEIIEKKAHENDPPKQVPVITNESIPEHRDEVLGSARKFIYPLQQSKHKIVTISIAVFLSALVFFFTYTAIALYGLQTNSTFIYKVTQLIPFPIARVGSDFVSYENYLFELRRYEHYYENQQKLDFNTDAGRQQLTEYKRRALDKVVDFSYIKDIAKENGISVTDAEVEVQIQLLRDQNRLGSGDQVFEDVLQDYFGWSVDEFKRYLSDELLTQKVVAAQDKKTTAKAETALAELNSGKSFADVAKKYSDDLSSKNNGGDFGFSIDQQSRDLTPQATDALFNLKKGQYSQIINTGYSLEIFKLNSKSGDRVEGAHILFNFEDINSYLNERKEQQPATTYISP